MNSISLIWQYMKGGVIGFWNGLTSKVKEIMWGSIGVVVAMMLIFWFFRRPILRVMYKIFGPKGKRRRYRSRRKRR